MCVCVRLSHIDNVLLFCDMVCLIIVCVFIQRVKKDVEKGTIHSDMFLLKREGKDGQGTKNVNTNDKHINIHKQLISLLVLFVTRLACFSVLQRSGRGPG